MRWGDYLFCGGEELELFGWWMRGDFGELAVAESAQGGQVCMADIMLMRYDKRARGRVARDTGVLEEGDGGCEVHAVHSEQ